MNNTLKKIICGVSTLTLLLSAGIFAACNNDSASGDSAGSSVSNSTSTGSTSTGSTSTGSTSTGSTSTGSTSTGSTSTGSTSTGSTSTGSTSTGSTSEVDPIPGEDEDDNNYELGKSTIVEHAAGKVKYKFEAEFTDLRGKTGNGYSGTGSEMDWVGDCEDGTSSGQIITFMYRQGCSLNFFVVSDRDVNDAALSLCLGGEYMNLDLNPNNYQVRVDTILPADEISGDDSSLGAWDMYFLNSYTVAQTGGYYVGAGNSTYECGKIEINAESTASPSMFKEYKVTTSLRLRKGINCISLIVNNSDPGPGTMLAHAPCVDYIAIETTAQLGMFDKMGNGGDISKACTIMN